MFMSNDNKKNFWFKLDKDKIKLQLKDIGSKFVDSRKSKRKIFLLITVCLIIGLGFVLYTNYNQVRETPDMKADISFEPTYAIPQEETDGEQEVGATLQGKTGENFSLQKNDLSIDNVDDKQNPPESKASEKNNNSELIIKESEVTAPLKPIGAIKDTDNLNLLRPVTGKILQQSGWFFHPVFQDWRYQSGVILQGQTGDIVMAAQGGTVSSIGDDEYRGITVTLQHENGWNTVYGNLERASVSEGNVVAKGQEVGRVGKSGYLGNSALYFELVHNGEAVEVSSYFN
jgi:murein DD-endopeptidase MepM/ murein hydrolase activator NlpD